MIVRLILGAGSLASIIAYVGLLLFAFLMSSGIQDPHFSITDLILKLFFPLIYLGFMLFSALKTRLSSRVTQVGIVIQTFGIVFLVLVYMSGPGSTIGQLFFGYIVFCILWILRLWDSQDRIYESTKTEPSHPANRLNGGG